MSLQLILGVVVLVFGKVVALLGWSNFYHPDVENFLGDRRRISSSEAEKYKRMGTRLMAVGIILMLIAALILYPIFISYL